MIRIREIAHVDAALIPTLHHEVATRHRNEPAVVRHTVLLRALRRRNLEVRVLRVLLVGADREDRVAAHLHHARRLTVGRRAAAPLVGVHDLRAVVAEDRGVPEREVRVGLGVETHRLLRIRNVDEQSIARARAGQQVHLRIRRHVVTVARTGRRRGGERRVRRRTASSTTATTIAAARRTSRALSAPASCP